MPLRIGRPKDLAKQAAIIGAARRLFATQSYDAVTMEAVASSAGVSKMTVYNHFGDKETLFERIVLAVSDEMLAGLAPARPDDDLRERLNTFGRGFLTIILREVCATEHSLPATLRANRSLSGRVYAAGPGRVRAALAADLASAAVRGELSLDDATHAADDLISLWEGGLPAKLIFGLVEPASAEEILRRTERGTDVFLRAYGSAGRGPSGPA
jgi:TetR/AcrR family transcriptional regulator, mexJK operon transcriptional repressor